MSSNLAEFESIRFDGSASNLYVSAFIGPKGGKAVQLTMKTGAGYTALMDGQVRRLVAILQARLDGLDSYRATDEDRDEWVPCEIEEVRDA